MPLPSSLEILPPEVIRVLHYLGTQADAVTPDQIDHGTQLGVRLVGKAIRRLVNYDFIQIAGNNTYTVTTDGQHAIQQLAENDARLMGQNGTGGQTIQTVLRRLTAVMPRTFVAGEVNDIYFGVNAPDAGQVASPISVLVELKISASAGSLSTANVSLLVPGDKAAQPSVCSLMPQSSDKGVRVRVDAFQISESYEAQPLGGIYFDVQVTGQPAPASRAVGMDLSLKTSG